MSHYPEEAHSAAESLPDAPAAPTKASARSFKKKFAKLKVQFEVRMRDSEALIREELRIQDLSKRIQEQNDQLLEVLLEFNDSLHISPDVRYDLTAPDDDDDAGASLPTPHRELSPSHRDPTTAVSRLKDAKAELAAGRLSVDAYHDLESAVKHGKAFAPRLHYRSLIQTPHTDPRLQESADERAPGALFEQDLGFLTPEHETEYYLAMDAKLGDESAALQLGRAPDKPSFAEREREAALRNPISVYNWLRRNQPQIFLQDNENASEKSTSRPSNLRTSKRAPAHRKDDDTHDEDGSTVDTGPTSGSAKNKRKRDDETGPKKGGGSSSRSSRKKKEDGGSTSKRSSKRSSGAGA